MAYYANACKDVEPIPRARENKINAREHSIVDFYRVSSPDLFHKCELFGELVADLRQRGLFQALYRVNLASGLDHQIRIVDPDSGAQREMLCFDSNSYLHLHRHPRVIEAVKQALDEFGYGTPSAQLLCGTNRHLRSLEETIARFHQREAALVFSSGYAANLGAITGLVRKDDLVVRDQFSHASIHDACAHSGSRFQATYGHLDCKTLKELLAKYTETSGCQGKLIVTDGVFSMHGRLAPLPRLSALAREYGARLMVDEAHSTGIIGATGRGIEEHFGLEGCVDLLMGTFSKAPGTVGGYVTGSREMIDYLRFYARSAMFSAALPAALCAGVSEAFRVMEREPQHRERLWQNVHRLVEGLRHVGFSLEDAESPILTLFVGSENLLWLISRDLFDAGIKLGNVAFPAVPQGQAILRMTVNARHTEQDLTRAVQIFERLGKRYDILFRTKEEISAIGSRLELPPAVGGQR